MTPDTPLGRSEKRWALSVTSVIGDNRGLARLYGAGESACDVALFGTKAAAKQWARSFSLTARPVRVWVSVVAMPDRMTQGAKRC